MNEIAIKFFIWLGKYSVPAILFAIEILVLIFLLGIAILLKQKGTRIEKSSERREGYNEVLAQGGMQVQILMKHTLLIPVFAQIILMKFWV